MKTRVVNWIKEPYDIYIGRGSKWGSPFKIGEHGTREEVIQQYEQYITSCKCRLKDLHELKGKVLGCWCKPEVCHGDVLARLADEL